MNDFNNKLDNAKDKIEGTINETAGKITGNQQLELKGKLQNKKADLEKITDIKHEVNKAKENIAGKINDMMDKKNKK